MSSFISKYCQQNSVGTFHTDESCEDEKCKIARQVRSLVEDLVANCVEMDPRLQCKLLLTGSTAEGTKMWAPDEFDFMMELTELEGHCDMDFSYDRIYPKIVIRDNVSRPAWEDFRDEEGNFSSTKLRNYVALLSWKAALSLQKDKYPNLSFSLSQYHNNTCRGCLSDQPLVKFSKVGVLLSLQWFGDQYKKLDIDVDLTPSIKFQNWPRNESLPSPLKFLKELGCHVIPLVSGNRQWRVSFSMAELNLFLKLSEQHLDIYKALKLLRDIHVQEGGTPSYLLKTMVFNYLFKEHSHGGTDRDLRQHVLKLLQGVAPQGPIRHFFMNTNVPMDSVSSLRWCNSSLKLLLTYEDGFDRDFSALFQTRSGV